MSEGRLGKRLRRILLLLPYAIKHPGVTLDELARKFGVKKSDLLDDLNLVFLCGLPGYGPGDLIDVTIDEERVFVRMADYFGAPLKLTPAEALSLYAGAAALIDLPGMEEADALRRAIAKLRRALGAGTDTEGAAEVSVKPDPAPHEHLDSLRRALVEHKRVRLEYFSAARGELSERKVDPWGLIAALGRWYLVGADDLSGDERMFRADRIKHVEILDETAEVPEGFDPTKYRKAFVERSDQATFTMEISPAVQRWFSEYYPVKKVEDLPGGWSRVELSSGGPAWAATLLLRLGDQARNVAPPDAETAARELAAAVAARYS